MFSTFKKRKKLTVTVKNGAKILVRPMQAGDADHLITLFENISSETRFRRFNIVLDHITDKQKIDRAMRMVNDALTLGFGLIAFAKLDDGAEVVVGGIRYIRLGSESAEFSITVLDNYQGLGLGHILLEKLITHAKEDGLNTLIGISQADNYRLRNLLKATHLPLSHRYDGPDAYYTLALK